MYSEILLPMLSNEEISKELYSENIEEENQYFTDLLTY